MKREVRKEWPKLADTRHLGKRVPRIDGPDKVTGRAKYTYDVNRPGLLHAKYVWCPHGHARVKAIDVSGAKALPGVLYAEPIVEAGSECHYAGWQVAVVAAESEEAAREAARRVKVDYEVLEHYVDDTSAEIPEAHRGREQERGTGDVDAAFAAADAVASGRHGCAVITHCCLESHGNVLERGEDGLTAWVSTQMVSMVGGEVGKQCEVDPAKVHVICQHLGGGFGSKFQFDGPETCRISAATGRPVKLMLERDLEIMYAGSRPSAHADVRVGVMKDGTITAWDSTSWMTDGHQGRGRLTLPYVFNAIPDVRTRHVNFRTNTGSTRAWRAPGHPQQCLITMGALEDAAAAIGMDPLDFFKKNLELTDRPDVYAEELDVAARLMDWKAKWQPRDRRQGVVRRGLGLSMHTWGGGGHESNSQVTIDRDGRVAIACGTQDLGVGTRTVLAVVVAETLGLAVEAVHVEIGDSRLPPSGASGGSTTVGGISSSSRIAAVDAGRKLCAVAAAELGVEPEALELKDGRVQVEGDASRGMSFAEACALIGPQPLVGQGEQDRSLMNQGVGGVQMAEVEVDVETGVVRMVKLVAVQDCGTIVDLLTAESQVYGAVIMGITSALYEERVMDPVSGTVLNPDMEFYRLAGIGDVGEIVVHMMQTEEHHGRGVIGLGEPPVISPLAAIANAVANAAGVRVPRVPFTPAEVLAALGKGAV